MQWYSFETGATLGHTNKETRAMSCRIMWQSLITYRITLGSTNNRHACTWKSGKEETLNNFQETMQKWMRSIASTLAGDDIRTTLIVANLDTQIFKHINKKTEQVHWEIVTKCNESKHALQEIAEMAEKAEMAFHNSVATKMANIMETLQQEKLELQ